MGERRAASGVRRSRAPDNRGRGRETRVEDSGFHLVSRNLARLDILCLFCKLGLRRNEVSSMFRRGIEPRQTMLKRINTHTLSLVAAPAAPESSCWQKPVYGRRFDENLALARRCFR